MLVAWAPVAWPPWRGVRGLGPGGSQVAEATEARLRRQADQEQTARRRAEEAQQRAKQRLKKKRLDSKWLGEGW